MVEKIKYKLDQYLEFDSNQLFTSKFNLVRVFGGAIRDIIADMEIHDVDILCGSKALSYVECVLTDNGYHYMDLLNGKDIQDMYKDIHVINEPHTWVKGRKVVQLIRPSIFIRKGQDIGIYQEGFNKLISNVDLSCCGVSYDGYELYEDYPNSILHCQSKVFYVNEKATMYSQKRSDHRSYKLIERGWKRIEDNNTSINRDLKVNILL